MSYFNANLGAIFVEWHMVHNANVYLQLPEEGQKWGFLIWLLFSYCGLLCIACMLLGKVRDALLLPIRCLWDLVLGADGLCILHVMLCLFPKDLAAAPFYKLLFFFIVC